MTRQNNNQGFTLVETLVAVFIFSTALVSLLTIASRGIQANASADLNIAAQYLAQEGIELALHTRNSNYIAGFGWDSGFDASRCSTACYVSYNPLPEFIACTGNCPVVQDNGVILGNGQPFVGGSNDTPFIRAIFVDNFARAGVQIVSRVEWQERGIPRSVEYTTTLYEWFPPTL